jgi:2-C-methyl-D-erythritol 2,4-cyclodiphosphate synthase
MQEAIASILKVEITDVSVKATTTEKMGFVGREEGLVAYATVLLEKK